MKSEEVLVHKVTLGSGKIVLLREMKIKDQELGAKAAANKVGSDNKFAIAIAMQQEFLKMLIVQIDGEKPDKAKLENLDAVFSYSEYQQLVQALDKITGGAEDLGNFQMEFSSSGS